MMAYAQRIFLLFILAWETMLAGTRNPIMPAKISQREALKLKKRVAELERLDRDRSNAYMRDYPGGIHIASIALAEVSYAKLDTAKRLGFALVGTVANRNELAVYALAATKDERR